MLDQIKKEKEIFKKKNFLDYIDTRKELYKHLDPKIVDYSKFPYPCFFYHGLDEDDAIKRINKSDYSRFDDMQIATIEALKEYDLLSEAITVIRRRTAMDRVLDNNLEKLKWFANCVKEGKLEKSYFSPYFDAD